MFGANAPSLLADALAASGGDPVVAADTLLSQGMIPAVQDASFDVGRGELFVIMGLSGSGKSTLIRAISHLIAATAGEIRIDGEEIVNATKARMIELRRKKLGMVFQHFGLFPHMKVGSSPVGAKSYHKGFSVRISGILSRL